MHAARVHSCTGRRAAYIGVHTDTALFFTALGFFARTRLAPKPAASGCTTYDGNRHHDHH